MFCYHCGKEVGEIDVFCPYCGTKIKKDEPQAQPQPPVQAAPQPITSPAPAKMSPLAAVGFGVACATIVLTVTAFGVADLFILPLLSSIAGLVLSIVGVVLNKKKGNNKAGKGLAITGIVLSAVNLVFVLILYVLTALAIFALFGWLFLLAGA